MASSTERNRAESAALEHSQQARSISGIRLASAATGVRYKNRDDVTLIEIAPGAAVHCLFTKNAFCAAPVTVAQRHRRQAVPRFLVINAGNANAGTGVAGERAAVQVCAAVAASAGCAVHEVLPFSTGVIGQQLKAHALASVVPALMAKLAADAWPAAAAAIMTTDTRAKVRSARVSGAEVTFTVTGIAKGSGMIKPNMATMLAYVATDAAVAPTLWQAIATQVAAASFNRITVDGDTSTNDALVLIATGGSGSALIDSPDHVHYHPLLQAVAAVCQGLAQDIVRDGEGATKFITVRVTGGQSEDDCLRVAYAVAESPLVKTAFFASDPNWGRILAAVGRSGVAALSIGEVSITLGSCAIVTAGEPAAGYEEAKAAAIMRQPDIEIMIGIGSGLATATVWTCDFSYDYVRINAEYRS